MKTVAQIAAEIGVSKQAVQKRIAREPLYAHLSSHLYIEKGTKYIDETGETLIKAAFSKLKPNSMSIDKTNTSIDKPINKPNLSIDKSDTSIDEPNLSIDNPTNSSDLSIDKSNVSIDTTDNQNQNVHGDLHGDIIKILQENITVLQKQLETKDRQIEELTSAVKTQAESINYSRQNELAETLVDGQQKLIEGDSPKRGFFRRLFSKR